MPEKNQLPLTPPPFCTLGWKRWKVPRQPWGFSSVPAHGLSTHFWLCDILIWTYLPTKYSRKANSSSTANSLLNLIHCILCKFIRNSGSRPGNRVALFLPQPSHTDDSEPFQNSAYAWLKNYEKIISFSLLVPFTILVSPDSPTTSWQEDEGIFWIMHYMTILDSFNLHFNNMTFYPLTSLWFHAPTGWGGMTGVSGFSKGCDSLTHQHFLTLGLHRILYPRLTLKRSTLPSYFVARLPSLPTTVGLPATSIEERKAVWRI